ncbi:hypothetical protein [Pseudomonas graminis]
METSTNDLVRTNSLFLIRNAIPVLKPLVVRTAMADSDGLIPLFTMDRDQPLTIPQLPQPAPPGARATIRVYVESPAPGEYQLVAYRQFTGYPDDEVEVMVPRRMLDAEGDYQLTYTLEDGNNVLRATASTPLRVRRTPPFGYLTITPPRPLLPTNLETALITEEYLANNDPVLFRIPAHREINGERGLVLIPYYGNTPSHMQVSYSVPPATVLSDVPADRLIPVPAAVIRARGNGRQQLTYRCLTRDSRRTMDSLILEVLVAVRITPTNIAVPRVTQAIAPDNTVTLGDINQAGQGGMEVWLDSVDGLQFGDLISVVLGAGFVVTTLTYAGQPLPLRMIVPATQIQAAVTGSTINDIAAPVRFRITSGGVVFNGPARNLIFNLSTFMTLAPPQVQNLNNGALNCNSPRPLNTPYANRFIQVVIPPSNTLIIGTTLTVSCVLSRQDDGSNPMAPAVTVPVILAAGAPTLGQTVNVPYPTTMGVIGRGVLYFSYSAQNVQGQMLRSAPVATPVRGVLPGDTYCDGSPFTPAP